MVLLFCDDKGEVIQKAVSFARFKTRGLISLLAPMLTLKQYMVFIALLGNGQPHGQGIWICLKLVLILSTNTGKLKELRV
jgi:hypothetical protein